MLIHTPAGRRLLQGHPEHFIDGALASLGVRRPITFGEINNEPSLIFDHSLATWRSWDCSRWRRYLCSDLPPRGGTGRMLKKLLHQGRITLDELCESLEIHLELLDKNNGKIIFYENEDYPPILRLLDDPPLMLNLIGDPGLLSCSSVSVIGSRRAPSWALSQAFALGQILAREGLATVSGGALGCDIMAHRGVLAATLSHQNALAIVVCAGGLGSLYPKSNGPTFNELKAKRGLFVSEHLWTKVPVRQDFPIRNRIISAWSSNLVIIHAQRFSGTMLTAHLALDQGRDIYVLSHPHDPTATGSVQLIDDGAMPLNSVFDLFRSS